MKYCIQRPFLATCLVFLVMMSCEKKPGGAEDNGQTPVIQLDFLHASNDEATFELKSLDSEYTAILIGTDAAVPSAAELLEKGVKVNDGQYVARGLRPQTDYYAHAAGVGKNGKVGKIFTVSFRTKVKGKYSWESARDGLPAIADMTLCYGGSAHRGAITDPNSEYWWRKERFAPHVTYVDKQGKEHWLFESFLFIEFADTGNNMSYSMGYGGKSSDRNSWQQLIDYWFAPDNGFNALEAAVEEAKGRIGEPKSKRYVIMNLPEALIYKEYANANSGTVYWGDLEGKVMDFSKAADRVAALTWYIDEVRERFSEQNYKNIELAGFYLINEDLAIDYTDPITHVQYKDGWSANLKHFEQVLPAISRYLDSVSEGLFWIPYYMSAGHKYWKSLYEIDWAVMQPNHFWDLEGKKPMGTFFETIEKYGYGMELEFDDNFLGSDKTAEVYKSQFRDYLVKAKEHGVYGTKPFALYGGQNTLYKLSKSAVSSDVEMYHEFCTFIIENPIKKY